MNRWTRGKGLTRGISKLILSALYAILQALRFASCGSNLGLHLLAAHVGHGGQMGCDAIADRCERIREPQLSTKNGVRATAGRRRGLQLDYLLTTAGQASLRRQRDEQVFSAIRRSSGGWWSTTGQPREKHTAALGGGSVQCERVAARRSDGTTRTPADRMGEAHGWRSSRVDAMHTDREWRERK